MNFESTKQVQGLGPIGHCPDCLGTSFEIDEQPTGIVVFVCLKCAQRWRFDLGYVWRVH